MTGIGSSSHTDDTMMFLIVVFASSFSPEDSCERCRDLNATITTVNVPAVSAYHQVTFFN